MAEERKIQIGPLVIFGPPANLESDVGDFYTAILQKLSSRSRHPYRFSGEPRERFRLFSQHEFRNALLHSLSHEYFSERLHERDYKPFLMAPLDPVFISAEGEEEASPFEDDARPFEWPPRDAVDIEEAFNRYSLANNRDWNVLVGRYKGLKLFAFDPKRESYRWGDSGEVSGEVDILGSYSHRFANGRRGNISKTFSGKFVARLPKKFDQNAVIAELAIVAA